MSKVKHIVCGEVLESKYRHDFVECSCTTTGRGIFVDGGYDYFRCGGDLANLRRWNPKTKKWVKLKGWK